MHFCNQYKNIHKTVLSYFNSLITINLDANNLISYFVLNINCVGNYHAYTRCFFFLYIEDSLAYAKILYISSY